MHEHNNTFLLGVLIQFRPGVMYFTVFTTNSIPFTLSPPHRIRPNFFFIHFSDKQVIASCFACLVRTFGLNKSGIYRIREQIIESGTYRIREQIIESGTYRIREQIIESERSLNSLPPLSLKVFNQILMKLNLEIGDSKVVGR